MGFYTSHFTVFLTEKNGGGEVVERKDPNHFASFLSKAVKSLIRITGKLFPTGFSPKRVHSKNISPIGYVYLLRIEESQGADFQYAKLVNVVMGALRATVVSAANSDSDDEVTDFVGSLLEDLQTLGAKDPNQKIIKGILKVFEKIWQKARDYSWQYNIEILRESSDPAIERKYEGGLCRGQGRRQLELFGFLDPEESLEDVKNIHINSGIEICGKLHVKTVSGKWELFITEMSSGKEYQLSLTSNLLKSLIYKYEKSVSRAFKVKIKKSKRKNRYYLEDICLELDEINLK